MFGPGPTAAAAGAPVVKKGLLDNYDDVEGYYNFQVWPASQLSSTMTAPCSDRSTEAILPSTMLQCLSPVAEVCV